jgi:hypothetical protein
VKYFEDKVKMCFRTYLEAGGRYNTSTIARNHKSYKRSYRTLDNNKIYEAGKP